jgi:hypothetical protein
MRKIILSISVTTVIFAAPARLWAAAVNGNIWTEFYSYRIKSPDTLTHVRSLQGLRLGVRDAFTPGLSLFVRGRIASDITHKFSSDPDFRVFGAYLEYTRWKQFALRVGRQFVYAGLGGLTMDGGKLEFKINHLITLTGYAGTTPGPSFFKYDEISPWKKSNVFGGRLICSRLRNWVFATSYQERGIQNNVDSRVVGVDFTYDRGKYSEFSRVDYDILLNKLKLVIIRPRMKFAQGHSGELEYMYREPTFGLSSPFSVFKTNPFHQIRFNPIYKIAPGLYGLGSIAYTIYKGDNNIRASAGGSYKGQSAGLVFADGYGGQKLGIFASLFYEMKKDLQLYFNTDLFNYKIDTDETSTTSSVSIAAGGYYRIIDDLNGRLEYQFLSNHGYKYDSRLYARIEYGIQIFESPTAYGGGNQ